MANTKFTLGQKLLILAIILVAFYALGGYQIIDPIINPAAVQRRAEEQKLKEAVEKQKIDARVQETMKYYRKHKDYYDAVSEKNDLEDYIKEYEEEHFNHDDDVSSYDFLP